VSTTTPIILNFELGFIDGVGGEGDRVWKVIREMVGSVVVGTTMIMASEVDE
jgi:hypothetical protein